MNLILFLIILFSILNLAILLIKQKHYDNFNNSINKLEKLILEEQNEKLILSAIKLSDECVVVKLQSEDKMNKSRHCFIIRDMVQAGIKPPINGEQGFLTSTGRFVLREEGKEIVLASGQIKSTLSNTLCSEDLW